MHFDSLPGLWFGLSLPAIVLLYLFKRKYVDTPVSSHMLWNRVLKDMEANRPWQKLRNRLLMLVQLLAAALLVLAIMQPWVWSQRSAKAHVVVVLDRSASMTAEAEGGGESRLDAAKRQVTEWASGEAKDSAITLLAMGEQADVLLSRETDRNRLREALAGIEPAYGKTVYRETMSLAAALTRNDPEAEIRLFTDGQFPEPVSGLAFAVPVTVHRIGEAKADNGDSNMSISQFGVKSNGKEGKLSAVASLKNAGTAPKKVEASLYAGDSLAEVKTVQIEAGKQAAVYFEGLAPADWYKLDIGSGDSFRIDNVSYAFPDSNRARKVLLVGDGNLFLEKALQLAGAEVIKLAPDNAQAWIGSQKAAGGPDLIAIDSVTSSVLASREWKDMLASRPVLYIRSGSEGKEAAVPAVPYKVEDHPVTRYLKFQDAHVATAWQPDGLVWGKSVVSAGDMPLLYAGTENGQPRLLIAFALQQSDWPLRTEFPVFVQNAVGWLTAAHGESLGRAVAGERKEIAMSPAAASAAWVSADGGGAGPAEAEKTGGRLSSAQTVPLHPGLYRLEEKDESGRLVQTRWIGVMADSREWGTAAAELSFDRTASGSLVAGETPDQASSGSADDGRRGAPLSLWHWAALLALAAVVCEWGVYRRGSSV
ncbi:VWA domain-containing protein [Paenibacillus hodogayensis]|uniref:VWA domain-containing protein n=1 Tax=Paenibacillus hodogayensis TaxID=279208 RepID=A0ABV5VQG2_9BACL